MELLNGASNPQLAQVKKSVSRALCELSANLMRITRGAGAPGALIADATTLLDALEKHKSCAGHYPTNAEIHAALSVTNPVDYHLVDASFVQAENDMIEGALAVAADYLLHGNSTTIAGTRGAEQMRRGSEQREEIRRPRTKTRAELARDKRGDQAWKEWKQKYGPALQDKP